MARHVVTNVDQFINMLQGCLLWSDTIRIEIDMNHQITMDLSDPEAMGCISISSSRDTKSSGSKYHVFLVDQLIEAFQTFIIDQNYDMGIYFLFTDDRAKLVNVQHEYRTQDIPICDYRPLHQFCHIELPQSVTTLELEFPLQEWNTIITTFCIFAGSRGTPLQFSSVMETRQNLVCLSMSSDAGHSVKTQFRCKPGTDIPSTEVVTVPIKGQVLLHNMLNACKLSTTPLSLTTTIRIHDKGIYQDLTFQNTPYSARMFYISVPTLDYDSFS